MCNDGLDFPSKYDEVPIGNYFCFLYLLLTLVFAMFAVQSIRNGSTVTMYSHDDIKSLYLYKRCVCRGRN